MGLLIPGKVVLFETGASFELDDYQIERDSFVSSQTGRKYDPFVEGWEPGLHSCKFSFTAFNGNIRATGTRGGVAEQQGSFVFTIHRGYRIRFSSNSGGLSEETWRRCCGLQSAILAIKRNKSAPVLGPSLPPLTAAAFDIRFCPEEVIETEREAVTNGRSVALFFEAGPLVGAFWEQGRMMMLLDRGDRAKLMPLARELFAKLLLGDFQSELAMTKWKASRFTGPNAARHNAVIDAAEQDRQKRKRNAADPSWAQLWEANGLPRRGK